MTVLYAAYLQCLEPELYAQEGMHGLRQPRSARFGQHSPDNGARGDMQFPGRAGDIAAMVQQERVEALEHAGADSGILAAHKPLQTSDAETVMLSEM